MSSATLSPSCARGRVAALRLLAHAAVATVIATAGSALTPATASAQLRICNKTGERVYVSVAYMLDGDWITRGWYTTEAGSCTTPVGGALQRRYYYVHARSDDGGTWGADYTFCVMDGSAFTYRGRGGCAASGYRSESFFQIDTGAESAWTQNLTSAAPVATMSAADVHEAIAELGVDWRTSTWFQQPTLVMQLRNQRPYTVTASLTCYTAGGSSKPLVVDVPGKGVAEVGWVQGWPGNFSAGERCEARHGEEVVWRVAAGERR